MSDFADAAANGKTSSELSSSALQTGLAALQRKDYQAAIVQLEAVEQTTTEAALWLKAQMGLVKAYGSTGKIDRAMALCQPLCQHPQSQIRTWAKQTLIQLEQRSKQQSVHGIHGSGSTASPDKTGFTPLSATKSKQHSPQNSQPDRPQMPETVTGFVPIASAPPVPNAYQSPELSGQTESSEEAIEELVAEESEAAIISALLSATDSVPSVVKPPSNQPETTAAMKLSQAETPVLPLETKLRWRQAGRTQSRIRLANQPVWPLWGLQILTVLLLAWVIQTWLTIAQMAINWLIFFFSWIPLVRSLHVWVDPTWTAVLAIGVLFSASPWLLDRLLQQCHRLKPLSLQELAAHSPESVRLLQRRQPQKHTPKLGILPATAPFVITYGYLPRHARIVVSRGLLQQLRDDEIATVYAAELEQIYVGNVGVVSGLVLVAQLPYWVYWTVSAWGDRQSDRVLQSIAVLVSSIGYGAYWCCSLAGRWLSHGRQYYGDRWATEQTGNPNGRIRTLLKMTIGMAEAVQRQGYTPSVLESFALLMPIDHRAALSVGSLYSQFPTPDLLSWDRSNRYRRWFSLWNSHPLLGDRIDWLSQYAKRWQLEPELNGLLRSSSPPTVREFLLQAAPAAGSLIGLAIAVLLSAVGWASYQASWITLDWLWLERASLCQGSLFLGFGIGLLLSINPSFPDIKRSTLQSGPALVTLLSHADTLPIDSVPVQIQGTLLGRRGFQNRLHQDLMLQTATGLIWLHYTSRAGFLGNLISQAQRPMDLVKRNESIVVTGWFRRGASPWIDVDTIQTQRGVTLRSGHPVLLTLLAIVAALLGVYVIFNGGW